MHRHKKTTSPILTIFIVIASTFNINGWRCDLISVQSLIQNSSANVTYKRCSPSKAFEDPKLPVTENHYLHPYKGTFSEIFILKISHGLLFSTDGWIIVDNQAIEELAWRNCFLSKTTLEESKRTLPIKKIHRMAVIAQSGHSYYYHWIVEILGRLALLEQNGEEYDALYVPTYKPFMKEALALWGVDPKKIIDATDNVIYDVDEIIVPSLISNFSVYGNSRLAYYAPQSIVDYIKNKLLSSYKNQNKDFSFCKKVFISRKDASIRKILNEDNVFALFQAQGFERYILSDLSFIEQIGLFNNAEIIVGTLGSGLTNILFCNNNALVVDIFQSRRDCTIYYLSQILGLRYQCVKTMDFIDENDGQFDHEISLDIIKDLLKTLTISI